MADEPTLEPGEDGYQAAEESPETWVSDGELWIADSKALCAEFGILAIATFEGNPVAYVRGKGAVSLHDLLKATKRAGAPTVIKGGKQ